MHTAENSQLDNCQENKTQNMHQPKWGTSQSSQSRNRNMKTIELFTFTFTTSFRVVCLSVSTISAVWLLCQSDKGVVGFGGGGDNVKNKYLIDNLTQIYTFACKHKFNNNKQWKYFFKLILNDLGGQLLILRKFFLRNVPFWLILK